MQAMLDLTGDLKVCSQTYLIYMLNPYAALARKYLRGTLEYASFFNFSNRTKICTPFAYCRFGQSRQFPGKGSAA